MTALLRLGLRLRLRLASALALVTSLCACGGPGNSLDGSISESFSLEFDSVQIRKQEAWLLVEYLKDVGGGTDKVCKVAVDTENLGLAGNTTLKDQAFLDRVDIIRVTAAGGDFPAIMSGQIHFDSYEMKDGGSMSGDFDAVFENGRTLHGTFEGTATEVPLD